MGNIWVFFFFQTYGTLLKHVGLLHTSNVHAQLGVNRLLWQQISTFGVKSAKRSHDHKQNVVKFSEMCENRIKDVPLLRHEPCQN